MDAARKKGGVIAAVDEQDGENNVGAAVLFDAPMDSTFDRFTFPPHH